MTPTLPDPLTRLKSRGAVDAVEVLRRAGDERVPLGEEPQPLLVGVRAAESHRGVDDVDPGVAPPLEILVA